MKRRIGMLIGIICVLIVGISVTKMTSQFIASKGIRAGIELAAADQRGDAVSGAGKPEIVLQTNAMSLEKELVLADADEVPEEAAMQEPAAIAAALEPAAAESGVTAIAAAGTPSEEMAAADAHPLDNPQASPIGPAANPEPQSYGPGVKLESVSVGPDAKQEHASNGPGARPEALSDGPGTRTESMANGPMVNSDKASAGSMDDPAVFTARPPVGPGGAMPGTEDSSYVEKSSVMDPALYNGPVKSPLDPVVETKPSATQNVQDDWMTAEDFFKRFERVETASVKLWENTTTDNTVAYNGAAEQERVLWDYELNLIYSTIRGRMSKEEAEELKHLELEWIKSRDQYAERVAAKSQKMNAQNQNPIYTRALAEKTKERCYWLVSEYEEILEREEHEIPAF